MVTVIIAEKPSQAKNYADACQKSKKSDGYYEVTDPELFQGNAIITWGFGHLVSLAEPQQYDKEWKKWSLATLPMIPHTFKFTVPYDKKKQYSVVKNWLKQATQIIVATDSDREGENIARSIIENANSSRKPVKRLWINSLESDQIRQGFKQLRSGEETYPLYKEAQTRQFSDWLIGMNLSRLYTLLLQKKGVDGPFSVGRVQTPTLFMIWQRKREIEQFKPEPYFELFADVKAQRGTFKAKHAKRFSSIEELKKCLEKHRLEEKGRYEGTIEKADSKKKRMPSPMLHSLSTLQTTLNRRFKYSPSAVLKAAQSLYEKKMISYPRTDCPYITTAEFGYLSGLTGKMKETAGVSFDDHYTKPRPRYVKNDAVQEHYAIIPTKKIITPAKLGSLAPMERNVYNEILRTALAMFHDDYHYEETVIDVHVHALPFRATGKVELKKGWKEIFQGDSQPKKEKEEQVLPAVTRGESVEAVVSSKKEMTKPPKPFTEGQLITMMKTAGKVVEDEEQQAILKATEGIGTEATRASIIDTLKQQKYITIAKNIVSITDKGETLCLVIEGTLLSSPEMTAKWELYLQKIGRQQAAQEPFLGSIEKFIRHLLEEAPKKVESTDVKATPPGQSRWGKKEPIVTCPTCKKGDIVDRRSFYGCSAYKEGCKQTFPKTIAGKRLSAAQIKMLCTKGKTSMLKGFKSKQGKPFVAALQFKDEKVQFDFLNEQQ